jgi:excisionase family DNA binding protein
MRPRRFSSFICLGSMATRQEAATLALGAATRDAPARREVHPPDASKSTPPVLPSDLPIWAVATAAAGGLVSPDPNGRNANADGARLVEGIGSLNQRRRAATIPRNPLEPLLTVAQAATILSVSERTVRRLIASGTIPGIWIGRSVRLRPRDIERWISAGGTCNN